MLTIKIFLSNSADDLRKKLAEFEYSATVEAEYGNECVEGSLITLAHHGIRSSNQPPCVVDLSSMRNQLEKIEVIGCSHMDLDMIGGVMEILGMKGSSELEKKFWKMAGEVDMNGRHSFVNLKDKSVFHLVDTFCNLENSVNATNISNKDKENLSILDVTEDVMARIELVKGILDGDERIMELGDKVRKWRENLNYSTYKTKVSTQFGDFAIRVTTRASVNDLYTFQKNEFEGIISYSKVNGRLTISVRNTIPGFSCEKFMQDIFGNQAGGRENIAGSPRGIKYPEQLVYDLGDKLVEYINKKNISERG